MDMQVRLTGSAIAGQRKSNGNKWKVSDLTNNDSNLACAQTLLGRVTK